MVLQEKDYLKKTKKKYLINTLIWAVLILGVYFTGIMLFNSKKSYFTVFAGVLVIGAALNLTRLIGFWQYRDGRSEWADILEQMKGSYDIFHSSIIPDNRGNAYFEHIVITSKSLYMITYSEACVRKYRLWLENKLASKGIPIKNIHIVSVNSTAKMKSIAAKIEKDACFTSGKKNDYTEIINGMLM